MHNPISNIPNVFDGTLTFFCLNLNQHFLWRRVMPKDYGLLQFQIVYNETNVCAETNTLPPLCINALENHLQTLTIGNWNAINHLDRSSVVNDGLSF